MAPNFRRGSAEAERAAEAQKAGSFQRVKFASLTPQQPTMIVRFLTDYTDWITIAQHQNMRTRPAPQGYQGNWPAALPAICRLDKTPDGERVFPQFADCYGCLQGVNHNSGKAAKALDRTFALAIERVPEIDPTTGRVASVSDKMVPVNYKNEKGDVETRDEPSWLIFAQAWSNFWIQIDAIGKIHGTILDRDIVITRTGFGERDTDYKIASLDPVMLEGGRKLDHRDPEIVAYYAQFGGFPDIGDLLLERASDEFYDRFFDVRHQQPVYESDKQQQNAVPGQNVAPPQTEVDPAKLAEMASRVANMGGMVQQYPAQAAPSGAIQQTSIAQPGFPQQS